MDMGPAREMKRAFSPALHVVREAGPAHVVGWRCDGRGGDASALLGSLDGRWNAGQGRRRMELIITYQGLDPQMSH